MSETDNAGDQAATAEVPVITPDARLRLRWLIDYQRV
jgi:hypothetical protein